MISGLTENGRQHLVGRNAVLRTVKAADLRVLPKLGRAGADRGEKKF